MEGYRYLLFIQKSVRVYTKLSSKEQVSLISKTTKNERGKKIEYGKSSKQ